MKKYKDDASTANCRASEERFQLEPEKLLEIMRVAERLKCNTRHSVTSDGRTESVAEHSWMLALMAMLLTDTYPELNMDRVIRMCLIHDLGEAFTGDIPTFLKTEQHSEKEEEQYDAWIKTFPEPLFREFEVLLSEMKEMKTEEAKLYKTLDKMEAVIQHNMAPISSWLPLEYDLQLTYGKKETEFSEWSRKLKETVDRQTREKIRKEKN